MNKKWQKWFKWMSWYQIIFYSRCFDELIIVLLSFLWDQHQWITSYFIVSAPEEEEARNCYISNMFHLWPLRNKIFHNEHRWSHNNWTTDRRLSRCRVVSNGKKYWWFGLKTRTKISSGFFVFGSAKMFQRISGYLKCINDSSKNVQNNN